MRPLPALTTICAFVLPVAALAAQPNGQSTMTEATERKIAAAEEAFKVQNYGQVVTILEPMLNDVRGGKLITEAFQRFSFYERLGAAMWFEQSRDSARRVFTDLLKLAPTYRLNALFYPQELIRFFENHKADLVSYGVIGKGGGTNNTGPRQIKVRTTKVNTTPTLAYVLPGGVGQFANGDDAKGAVVLTLQVIGLAGAIGAWAGHRSLIGKDPKQEGEVLEADVSTNDALIGVSIGGWALFGAAFIYSIVDGFVSRPPREETTERNEVLDPDDERRAPTTTSLPPSGTAPDASPTWHVGPGPGLGLGVGGTF